jgi:hypothetical protein
MTLGLLLHKATPVQQISPVFSLKIRFFAGALVQ